MHTKVALVTGAAQGIGRAIAHRLAHDGYTVALHDIHYKESILSTFHDELSRSHPERRHTVATADVSKDEEVQSMVAKVVEQSGSLDVLVANAGKAGTFRTLVESHVSQADDIWETNVRGVWLCLHHAAKQMIAQGRGGRIVSAGSLRSKVGRPGAAAYCASKFAVRGLTQSAACELGQYGITVNAYAPGAVETPLLKELFNSPSTSFEEAWENYIKLAAMKRNPEASDIAALVSFLVSEGARNITGQTITVDGGIHFD